MENGAEDDEAEEENEAEMGNASEGASEGAAEAERWVENASCNPIWRLSVSNFQSRLSFWSIRPFAPDSTPGTDSSFTEIDNDAAADAADDAAADAAADADVDFP